MSPKKDETAVRDCNPALSVLVVLVSRKVAFSRSISLAILLYTKHLEPETYRFTIKSCLQQYDLLKISTTAINVYKPGIRQLLLYFSAIRIEIKD